MKNAINSGLPIIFLALFTPNLGAACYQENAELCYDGNISEAECLNSINGELLTVEDCPENIFSAGVCEVTKPDDSVFRIYFRNGWSKKGMKKMCVGNGYKKAHLKLKK